MKHRFLLFFFITSSYMADAQEDSLLLLENSLTGIEEGAEKVELLQSISYGYLHSNPKKARGFAENAGSISAHLGDQKGLARSASLIGSSFWAEGDYGKAGKHYFDALKKYETIENREGMAEVNNNIGEMYKKQGNMELCLNYLLKALEITENHLEQRKAMLIHNNIGEAYYEMGRFDKALEYHALALNTAKPLNNDKNIAYAYNGIANVYMKQKDYSSALAFHRKAYKMRKKMNDQRGMAYSSNAIGEIYTNRHMYANAKDYLKAAEGIIGKIGAKDLEVTNYKAQSKLAELVGDYKQSLAFHKMYTALKDSLQNASIVAKVANIRASYISKSMDRENELLKREKEVSDTRIRSQNLLLLGAGVGFILMSALVYMLYKQSRQRKIANAILLEKNREIQNKNEEILFQADELKVLHEKLNGINLSLEYTAKERLTLVERQNEQFTGYSELCGHDKLKPQVASLRGLVNLIEYSSLNDYDQEIIHHLKVSATELEGILTNIKNKLGKKS